MEKVTKVLVLTTVAALLGGCTRTTDDGGPEEYPELSLGWARLLAEEVRDAELPGGELTYAFAGYVDADGLLVEGQSLYRFFFAEPAALLEVDGLLVTVYYPGDAEHTPGKCEYDEPLPDFSDAGPWIEAADGAIETIGGVEYSHRTYEVREAVLFHAWADFVVQVDYWWEREQHRARVILDAETGEIIDVDDFR
jgi:hypothetical protein